MHREQSTDNATTSIEMRPFSNVVLSLAVAFLPSVATTPVRDDALSSRAIPGRYIIGFNEGVDAAAHTHWARSVHKRNLGRRSDASMRTNGIETVFRRLNAYVGDFDPATIEEIRANTDVSKVLKVYSHGS